VKISNQTILEPAKEHAHSAIGLPEGWVETTLDHLLQALESGSRPKGGVRGITEGIPSIGGEHLDDNGGFRFENIKFVPYSFFEKMKRGRIQNGDILVVKDGATTGKVSLVRESFPYDPAVINEHVFICRPAEGTYPPYLFYFLFSKEGQGRILENFRGSAQGGINQSFVQGTITPLAPLPEQKRIVAKVEELLAQVNSARECLSKGQKILKRFRQSVLTAACSGHLTADWREKHSDLEPVTEIFKWIRTIKSKKERFPVEFNDIGELQNNIPDTWCNIKLKNILNDIKYGTSKKCNYDDSKTPVLRIPNVVKGYIEHRDMKYARLPDKEYEKLKLKKGDILLVRSNGSVALVGKTALVTEKENGYAYAGYLIRLRFDTKKLSPNYINLALSTHKTRIQIELPSRSTSGVHNINIEEISNLEILLPPSEEQHEIVRRVEALFEMAGTIEKRLEASIIRAERLTQAILFKAFRGELVPTEAELARREGHSYEHASTLLANIKEQRQEIMPRRTPIRVRQQRNNGLAQRDTIYSLARESDPRILASVLEVLKQYGALPTSQISLALRERGLSFKKDKAYTVRKEFEFLGWIQIETDLWELTSVGRKIAEAHPTSQLDLFARTLIVAHESLSTQGATKLLHKMLQINPTGQGAIIIPQPLFHDLSKEIDGLKTWLTKELERWNNALKKEMQGFQFLDASKTVNHIISQSLTKWADLSASKRRSNLLRAIADRYLDMMFQDLMSPADVRIWQNRLDWGGITHTAQKLSGVAGHIWFPTGSFRAEGGKHFTPVEGLTYEGQTFYRHTPSGSDFLKRFSEVLYEGYIQRQREEQVEYVSLLAVRDWTCYRLRISHAVFEENLQDLFPQALRGELPVTLALEVDITPSEERQLGRERPVIIDGTPCYILAMRSKK